ncbi:MAG: SIS domain-containing protein [Actinomycetota bacterium]|nr:SIS domain-containing protein [Actinomycetota bacterium]
MSAEPTGFLYPFLDDHDHDADDPDRRRAERAELLADLTRSAAAKIATSRATRADTLQRCRPAISAAAVAMAVRVVKGGRIWCFGNGGSSTDADAAVARFRRPSSGPAIAAASLVADRAVLTALANDVGFELVFARQLIAHGRAGDVALGISTSGGSANVLAAFAEARRRGLLTVGLSGYDGGAMTTAGLDHCLVVGSDSVHRIQEAQDAVLAALHRGVQDALGDGDGGGAAT